MPSAQLLKTYAKEALWLTCAIAQALLQRLYDRVLRCLYASERRIPLSRAELVRPNTLAQLLGTTVKTVSLGDSQRQQLSDANELGAGGAGTRRYWLVQGTAAAGTRLFCKLPAETLFESLFLDIFGVYANEVRFYNTKIDAPSHLFAKAYAAEMSRGRFVLCLEDVGARGVTFPVIDTPHAGDKVEAVLEALATLHATCWGWPPRGVWNDETRPPFLRLIADSTLRTIRKRWPDLLTADVVATGVEIYLSRRWRGGAVIFLTSAQVATYQLYLDHYDTVRAHWSSGLLVLVHGDAHLGNVFFHEKDGSAGFYDMQCVAAEHPMRDVAYHLILSCDSADLARNERAYVEAYLRRIAAKGQSLSYEAAWREYRLHALWALTALVISAGASADYFAEGLARLTISRAAAAVERVDARGALLDLID